MKWVPPIFSLLFPEPLGLGASYNNITRRCCFSRTLLADVLFCGRSVGKPSQRAGLHVFERALKCTAALFPLFLQLVVKLFNGAVCLKGGPECALAIMTEEVEKMTKLQKLGVPFQGTFEDSTTEWNWGHGRTCPAIIMKRSGR